MTSACRPLRRGQGSDGIALRDGKTLPFVVSRAWSAPEGYYPERWYLIDPGTREVLIEGPPRDELIWGLQSLTELSDEVKEAHPLAPGSYKIVFALGGLMGGDLDVEAAEVVEAAA